MYGVWCSLHAWLLGREEEAGGLEGAGVQAALPDIIAVGLQEIVNLSTAVFFPPRFRSKRERLKNAHTRPDACRGLKAKVLQMIV